MKSKNLILSLTGFIIGLFILVLPNFAEEGGQTKIQKAITLSF